MFTIRDSIALISIYQQKHAQCTLVVDKAAKSKATHYDVHYLFIFAFQIAMDASALLLYYDKQSD